MRGAVSKKHPKKSMTELSVVMGEQWGKLADASKEQYQKLAEEDKLRYEKEMKAYKPTPAWLEAKAYL